MKKIEYKEILNMKLEQEFCTSEKQYYQDYLCSICLNIVEDPVYISCCESVFCRDCSNLIKKKCPNCRKEIEIIPIPRIVKNHLFELEFRCPLECLQSFSYEQKVKHFSECNNKHKIIPACSLCNSNLSDSLKEHSKICEKLVFKCLFCNEVTCKLELEEHLKKCKCYLKYCEHCKTEYPNKFEQAHEEYYCNKINLLKKQISDYVKMN